MFIQLHSIHLGDLTIAIASTYYADALWLSDLSGKNCSIIISSATRLDDDSWTILLPSSPRSGAMSRKRHRHKLQPSNIGIADETETKPRPTDGSHPAGRDQ